MITSSDWWDKALDTCFVRRLEAESLFAELEHLEEMIEDVSPPSLSVTATLPYLKKSLELTAQLSAELFALAKSRKARIPRG